ncbi:porin family protein [Compostibacter hankyongensis]|uniref:Outer membrane protein beta-barrel domain-containing protein n=1 Tax=Compostibacter hankyongensis TaxID=1007089 RepID=A0ABP8FP98_9BACT
MKKSPPNMSDEELDRLFREAAAQYEPPPEPDAWDRFAQRLDKPPGKENKNRFLKYGWIALLLLLSVAVLLWQMPGRQQENKVAAGPDLHSAAGSSGEAGASATTGGLHQPNADGQQTNAGEQQTGAGGQQTGTGRQQPDAGGQERIAEDAPGDVAGEAAGKPAREASGLSGRTGLPGSGGSDNAAAGVSGAPLPRSGRANHTASQVAAQRTPDNAVSPAADQGVEGHAALPAAGKNTVPAAAQAAGDAERGLTGDTETPGQRKSLPDALSEDSGAVHGNARKKAAGYKAPRWQIGLTAGPDMGFIHGKSGHAPGVNAGLTLQYRFSRRWSVETGLLAATKIYSSRPEDYHPPTLPGYPLSSVDANCTVLDLPLNIQYDFLQKSNSRLYASAGLSSFWMKKEDYTYNYKTDGITRSREWSIYNQNRHLFSIVNLSMGYEYRWKRLSLQAAPYVKIPMGGIGYGKVRLTGTGILVSLKYGF